jgi:hypothetical protein
MMFRGIVKLQDPLSVSMGAYALESAFAVGCYLG